MKKKSLLDLVVMLMILLACSVFVISNIEAATYYVDANAINASDSNPGTSSQPWKTLNRAYTWYSGTGQKVQEGDTVLFRNGSYGQFIENTAGNPRDKFVRSNWVTYKADSGHKPVIDRIYIRNWNADQYQPSYLIFDGFELPQTVLLEYCSYVQILNCAITTPAIPGIDGLYAPYIVYGSDGVTIESSHYITIENNDISNAMRGIQGSRSSDIIVRNNVIHRIGEDGFSIGNPNLLIEGNYIYDIDPRRCPAGIWGTLQGVFIEGETVVQAGTGAQGIVNNACKDWGGAQLKIIQTNGIMFGKQVGGGGTVTGLTSNATVSNITDRDYRHDDGLQVHASVSNVVIRNNIINRDVGWGMQGMKLATDFPQSPLTNVTLENNLVSAVKPLLMWNVDGLNLYNNTFYTSGVGAGERGCVTYGIVNITNMYNNIIRYLKSSTTEADVTIVNHGNNIFGTSADFAGSPLTFTPNPTEITNYDIDSLFADPANNDFHLKAGSAAINFGNPSYGPATDIEGNSRVGAPDAGCYEYGSSPIKGDLNRDGKVNIQDVQCCVNHILGKQDWGKRADVNGDGKADKSDIEEIINIIIRD